MSIAEKRKLLNKLDSQRRIYEEQLVESQIEEKTLLGANYDVGCKLVDPQGYPIPVDVYAITHLRAGRVKTLNDLKDTNKILSESLIQLHSLLLSSDENEIIENSSDDLDRDNMNQPIRNEEKMHFSSQSQHLEPFLIVEQVIIDSPAHNAHLADGDQILQLGHITQDEFSRSGLKIVAQLIQDNKDTPIEVTVLSASSFAVITLTLIPQTWDGQGLLGCKVVPIHSVPT